MAIKQSFPKQNFIILKAIVKVKIHQGRTRDLRFVLADGSSINYEKGETIDCENVTNYLKCNPSGLLDMKYYLLEGVYYLGKQVDHKTNSLSYKEKLVLMKSLVEEIKENTVSNDYGEQYQGLRNLIFIELAMIMTKCSESNNYNLCRQDKQKIQKELFNLGKKYLKSRSDFIDLLKVINDLADKAEKVKTFERLYTFGIINAGKLEPHLKKSIGLVMIIGMLLIQILWMMSNLIIYKK